MISKLVYKTFLVSICLVCASNCFAHKANEAFFTITQKENTILVEAEFPWSIRNVLVEYNPSLSKTSTRLDFVKSLEKYIQDNLMLFDKSGEVLGFLSLKQLNQQGHSHQTNFEIYFSGSSFVLIQNTLFFNFFQNQKNYHLLKESKKEFITSIKVPRFKITNESHGSVQMSSFMLIAFSICFVAFLLHFFYSSIIKNKKAKSSGIT